MKADPHWHRQVLWAREVGRPTTPEQLAVEFVFVVCNSGLKAAVARSLHQRCMRHLEATGEVPAPAFAHPGKRQAINWAWGQRARLFDQLASLRTDRQVVEWAAGLPWIGTTTAFHLARNLGADVVKPDRHLVRLAYWTGEGLQAMCERLARETGERIGVVDLVLWWGCANGWLEAPPLPALEREEAA